MRRLFGRSRLSGLSAERPFGDRVSASARLCAPSRDTLLASAEAFNSVVIDGAMVDRGMAGWGEVLTDDDAEAIRAFIVFMANQ